MWRLCTLGTFIPHYACHTTSIIVAISSHARLIVCGVVVALVQLQINTLHSTAHANSVYFTSILHNTLRTNQTLYHE
jgi:hypothetical protein